MTTVVGKGKELRLGSYRALSWACHASGEPLHASALGLSLPVC